MDDLPEEIHYEVTDPDRGPIEGVMNRVGSTNYWFGDYAGEGYEVWVEIHFCNASNDALVTITYINGGFIQGSVTKPGLGCHWCWGTTSAGVSFYFNW